MEEHWSNLSFPHGKGEAVTRTEVKDALFSRLGAVGG